jgi:hypothetical protein
VQTHGRSFSDEVGPLRARTCMLDFELEGALCQVKSIWVADELGYLLDGLVDCVEDAFLKGRLKACESRLVEYDLPLAHRRGPLLIQL